MSKRISSIDLAPRGNIDISPDLILNSARAKNVGHVAIGRGDTVQTEVHLDENGIAYVDMNQSGRLNLDSDENGLLATSSLAGCTGVAGFAKCADGSTIQFLSHYDLISQTYYFTKEESPINSQMYGFYYDSSNHGGIDGNIQFLIAYDESSRAHSLYGQRAGVFEEWTPLEQIETTAEQLAGKAEILFLPYHGGEGNNLSVGRTDRSEGIYWNGVHINFAEYIKP